MLGLQVQNWCLIYRFNKFSPFHDTLWIQDPKLAFTTHMPDEPIYNAIAVDNPLNICTQCPATDSAIYEQPYITDSAKRASGGIQRKRFSRHYSSTSERKNIR